MGILKAETIRVYEVTMENLVLMRIISVVSGSNFCPLIVYMNTYCALFYYTH